MRTGWPCRCRERRALVEVHAAHGAVAVRRRGADGDRCRRGVSWRCWPEPRDRRRRRPGLNRTDRHRVAAPDDGGGAAVVGPWQSACRCRPGTFARSTHMDWSCRCRQRDPLVEVDAGPRCRCCPTPTRSSPPSPGGVGGVVGRRGQATLGGWLLARHRDGAVADVSVALVVGRGALAVVPMRPRSTR